MKWYVVENHSYNVMKMICVAVRYFIDKTDNEYKFQAMQMESVENQYRMEQGTSAIRCDKWDETWWNQNGQK